MRSRDKILIQIFKPEKTEACQSASNLIFPTDRNNPTDLIFDIISIFFTSGIQISVGKIKISIFYFYYNELGFLIH